MNLDQEAVVKISKSKSGEPPSVLLATLCAMKHYGTTTKNSSPAGTCSGSFAPTIENSCWPRAPFTNFCQTHHDIASAALMEIWTDETERRVCA